MHKTVPYLTHYCTVPDTLLYSTWHTTAQYLTQNCTVPDTLLHYLLCSSRSLVELLWLSPAKINRSTLQYSRYSTVSAGTAVQLQYSTAIVHT